MLGLLRDRRRTAAAHGLYAAMVEQARRVEFYAGCAVPDTLDGRFDLLVLHAFLVLHRLAGEPRGKALSQSLFDLMFADFDGNLRELGVSDLAVGKRIKSMAKAVYGRIGAYEPGLADAAVLADALRRNLYRGQAVPEVAVMAMTHYVQAEAAGLAAQELAALLAGRLSFGAPPAPAEAA